MKRKQEISCNRSNNSNSSSSNNNVIDLIFDDINEDNFIDINNVDVNNDENDVIIEVPKKKKISIINKIPKLIIEKKNKQKKNIELVPKLVEPKLSKNQILKNAMDNLPYSSSDWSKNECFNDRNLPPSIIDYTTCTEIDKDLFPDDWSSKESAKHAVIKSKQRKPSHLHAILIGNVCVHLNNCSEELLKELVQENIIDDEIMDEFDEDGEFNTPNGQIPITRLMDELDMMNDDDKILIKSLFALQSPQCSQWNLPFIRLISNHIYNKLTETLHVKIYIYFTRLIFELIADEAIKCIMDRIENIPAKVIEVQKQVQRPILFKSPQSELRQHSLPSYQFSLAGLLKNAESQGYDFTNTQQPQGLNVELFEFQLSTYQWMLDQENNKRGLNSYFWEEFQFSYGLSLYYFPLAGEFRLIKPPITTGGLLCEEMGLGKTVEILSIILGNPYLQNTTIYRPPAVNYSDSKIKAPRYSVKDDNIDSRATLIVVPSTLIGQWWKEMQLRVNIGNTKNGKFNCINLADKDFRTGKRLITYHVSPDNIRPAFIGNGDDIIDNTNGPWGITNGMVVFESVLIVDVKFEGSDIIYRGSITSETTRRYPFKRVVNIINHNHEFFAVDIQIDDYLYDHDIVLTNYDSLRNFPGLYKKVNWHRVVLDECQEIKVSTNKIAISCNMLVTKHRWMVSGTPLCNKIEDLHGELNFLKVIPFCLPDITDGFWLNKIGNPWKNRSKSSLKLLQSLISVVMMRHSKSQTYLDGRNLVPLVPRTIEWRGFDVTDHSELYILRYLEIFAADTMTKILESDSNINKFYSNPSNVHLKSLLGIISRVLTHPKSCELVALDHLKRMLGSDRIAMIRQIIDSSSESIPILPADQVLEMLQQIGGGRDGGLNRSTNRIITNTQKGLAAAATREKYLDLNVKELTKLFKEKNLDLPMGWYKIKDCHATIMKDTSKLNVFQSDPDDDVFSIEDKDKEKKLSDILQVQDKLRLTNAENEQNDCEVLKVINKEDMHDAVEEKLKGIVQLSQNWPNNNQREVAVYKYSISKRKFPYISKLISTEFHGDEVATVNAAGFSTIYKLMAGQTVECPLCLDTACRPTVTQCCHVHCLVCILEVISRDETNSKCPVCRRPIDKHHLMEIQDSEISEQNQEEERAKNAENGSEKDSEMTEQEKTDILHDSSCTSFPSSSSSSSSSSSNQLNNKSVINSVNQLSENNITDETKFIIPTLDLNSSAPTLSDLNEIPRISQFELVRRNNDTPSLDQQILTHFSKCTDGISPMHISSRFASILNDIEEVHKEDPFAKFIIFSQYSESLANIAQMFQSINSNDSYNIKFKCAIIDGKGNSKTKEKNLTMFNNEPTCNICLLATGPAATGLTLTIAKVCYFIEPTSNAADEAQALSRIHRIGQSQSVKCVIFYAKNTFEERLLAIRQRNGILSELLSDPGALGVSDDVDMFVDATIHDINLNNSNNNNSIRSNLMDDSNSEMDSNDELDSDSDSDSDFDGLLTNKEHVRKIRNKNLKEKLSNKESSKNGHFYNPNNLKILFGVTDERIKKVKEEKEQTLSNRPVSTAFGFFSSSNNRSVDYIGSSRNTNYNIQRQEALEAQLQYERYQRINLQQQRQNAQNYHQYQRLEQIVRRDIIVIDDSDDNGNDDDDDDDDDCW